MYLLFVNSDKKKNRSKAAQMVSMKNAPISILPTTTTTINSSTHSTVSLLGKGKNGHYKQTASHSVLSVIDGNMMNEIWHITPNGDDMITPNGDNMLVMEQQEVINNDDDDDDDDGIIITKQATFENAENDQEIMSEKHGNINRTKKYTMKSEGDVHRLHKFSIMDENENENENETIGYDLDIDDVDATDHDDAISPMLEAMVTIDAPITFGGSFEEIHIMQ